MDSKLDSKFSGFEEDFVRVRSFHPADFLYVLGECEALLKKGHYTSVRRFVEKSGLNRRWADLIYMALNGKYKRRFSES